MVADLTHLRIDIKYNVGAKQKLAHKRKEESQGVGRLAVGQAELRVDARKRLTAIGLLLIVVQEARKLAMKSFVAGECSRWEAWIE